MTFLKLAQIEFSALQTDSVHLIFYFPVLSLMCYRTLQNLHCWDIELPKHASLLREAARSVCFTLISAWNQMEWMEDEEDIVCIVPKAALAYTWPLWWHWLVLFILFLVSDPTLAWCFHWGFHWSSPRRLPPSPAVYLESATASGESRGPFEACWLPLLFCCLGRFFGGGVTQWCIVFYSLALLGVHPKFGSAESTK